MLSIGWRITGILASANCVDTLQPSSAPSIMRLIFFLFAKSIKASMSEARLALTTRGISPLTTLLRATKSLAE